VTAKKKARVPKAKKLRACKYGPRGEDGLCPKKPRAPKKAKPTKKQLADDATLGERILDKKISTGYGRKQKVGTVIVKAAEHAAGQTATDITKQLAAKSRELTQAQILAAAKAAGLFIARLSLPLAALALGAWIGHTVINNVEQSEVLKMLTDTEARLGYPLTESNRKILANQYLDFIRQRERARALERLKIK